MIHSLLSSKNTFWYKLFDRLVVNCNSYEQQKKAMKRLNAKEIIQKKKLQQFQFRWCHGIRIRNIFSCLYINKKKLICFIKEITKLFITNNLWLAFKHVGISSLCLCRVAFFNFILLCSNSVSCIVMLYCLRPKINSRWFIKPQLCTILLIKFLFLKTLKKSFVAVNLLVNKF